MKKSRKTPAPSGGGFTPVAFFWTPCQRKDGTRFKNKRSPRGMFRPVLSTMGRVWDGPRKPGTTQSEALFACFREIHELLDDVALISRPSRPAKLRLGLSRTSESERLSVKERKPISVLICLLACLFACKYVK